jgi:serine O-acetyltransferase
MITCKEDYLEFIRCEIKNSSKIFLINYFNTSFNPIARFLLLLRTSEYLKNCSPFGVFTISIYKLIKFLKYRKGLTLGFSIPENVADKGLQLPHYGTIVINSNARIGENCRIHVCVNIGASGGSSKAPQIGNNVYIAPGVKIYGDIIIADRIAVAANAAVSKSFLNSDKIIGGVPAKEIGDVNIVDHIKF